MRTIKGETFHSSWGLHPGLLSPSQPGALSWAGVSWLDISDIGIKKILGSFGFALLLCDWGAQTVSKKCLNASH